VDHAGARHLQPDLNHQVLKNLPVLPLEDRRPIGANYDAIACAEDRDLFREAMAAAGLRMPRSEIVTSLDEARAAMTGAHGQKGSLGLPCVVRPAYTLGGRGGGIAYTEEQFERIVAHGIEASPIGQVQQTGRFTRRIGDLFAEYSNEA